MRDLKREAQGRSAKASGGPSIKTIPGDHAIRYTGDYGCRHRGIPHDLVTIHETIVVKWEKCKICSKSFRWNKGYRGRVVNTAYLKAHVRNFAQRFGATKRIYNKLYNPHKCVIVI